MSEVEGDIEKLLAGEIVDTGSIDLSSRPQSSAAPNGNIAILLQLFD